MGDKSGIEWTDATYNPVVGCSVVSPGCTNCYAMKMAARLEAMGGKAGAKYTGLTAPSKAGPVWNGTVRLDEGALDQPLRWKRPRRIFVNSMSDLFHEDLPFAEMARVFEVIGSAIRLRRGHVFQILTKRPERMADYFDWARADSDAARPMHPDWVRALRDQCEAAGVPFLFKQWGEWSPGVRCDRPGADTHRFPDGTLVSRQGKRRTGHLLDGRAWDDYPGGADG